MARMSDRLREGIGVWTAYYRANIHRFAKDYLHLELKFFQKILLTMMNICVVFVFIGSRGIGKTYLTAVFCTIRAILYPGTKICIASGTRGQGINVLEKIILELKPNSPELAGEIDEKLTKINGTNAQAVFKNGSYIKVVTAGDSARGNRANILIIDESRMVKKDIIDTILRKFLTQRRMPPYRKLSKNEKKKAYNREKNMTMYLTSAYFQDSWMYLKCEDTFKFMVDDSKKQFVCGLPYQLSIDEGLLDADTVADEMAETDFSEVKFGMEYGCTWFGSDGDAFFDYTVVSKNRHIKYAMLPARLAAKVGNAVQVRIKPKENGEYRILSADIALMSSAKHDNDASAIFINSVIPTKAGRHCSNIVYAESSEGMRTEEQALMIRRLYEEYECDYIVLDTNGIGLGVFDCLAKEMADPDTGEIYPALSCCNDKTMETRCADPNAAKVIWSVKASAQFNSDCAFLLREGFKSGRIRLLENEYDADESLSALKGYDNCAPQEKVMLQLPYINTTLLIDELVKLKHEDAGGGKIRILERSNMRKDRYSSLSYNYYVALQLENRLARKSAMNQSGNFFIVRAPKRGGRSGARRGYGRFDC